VEVVDDGNDAIHGRLNEVEGKGLLQDRSGNKLEIVADVGKATGDMRFRGAKQ
jgi:hypothetical protein